MIQATAVFVQSIVMIAISDISEMIADADGAEARDSEREREKESQRMK